MAVLISLDSSYLSPGCSSSDLSELNDAKNAAKDNADAVVTTQTTLISAKTDELNALVLLILALNQQISAAGGTIIDPGTSVTPVPVDGEWQEWGQWSDCDPSCSCGKKIRARACTAPLFGGNDCIGDPTETAPCSGTDLGRYCSMLFWLLVKHCVTHQNLKVLLRKHHQSRLILLLLGFDETH